MSKQDIRTAWPDLKAAVQPETRWMAVEQEAHAAMTKFRYFQVSVDHCIYIQTTKNWTSIITMHVDDVLGCTSSKREMRQLKKGLESVFNIKDMGEAHCLLRVSISHDRVSRTISLSQTA